ncbi:MAG: DUF296 domain-containing protein [Rhizobium sp.]|nr:MAG: DUF296 domain-containing protein [Rhizobium sp.]
MGRVAYARIAPNEDLVLGVEKLCLAEGFRNAFVRGALGSLVDACLGTRSGDFLQISGPAVEIVSIAVYGGPFIAGANPVCMTFEVTLEEWLPTEKSQAA